MQDFYYTVKKCFVVDKIKTLDNAIILMALKKKFLFTNLKLSIFTLF